MAFTATGCAPSPTLLAAPDAWQVVAPADDPWPGGTDMPACPERAGRVEEGFFEIDLKQCPWVTARATSLSSVPEGHPIGFLVFHGALVADDETDAEATLALVVGTEIAWEQHVPIPSPDDFYEVEVPNPVRLREGDPMFFHVHNHGTNSYRLGDVFRAETQ